MKRLFTSLASLASAAMLAAVALPAAAADVGVSVQISQPGVYGRVDIGRFPQPQVVLAQPIYIGRAVTVRPEPVYMWVPPGHRKNWRKHCSAYGACGVPVYFVRDDWYGSHVRPQREDHRDSDRYSDRYDDRNDDRGHGKYKDKDKDKDKHKGKGHKD